MSDIVQLFVSGISTGAIYALAAMGFTLLWQTTGTINFAQGEFVMLPAFIMLAAMNLLDVGLLSAFVISLVVSMVLLGAAFKRALVDPMAHHGVLPLIIATIALGIFMKEAVKTFYSAEAQPFAAFAPEGAMRIGPVSVSIENIAVLAVAVVAILALQLFLQRTFAGRCMQAVAQNRESARILGVPVERMVLYTFLINAALATLAALLVTPTYLAKFDNGESLGLIAFIAAIVGGFNQMRGALAGGLLIGLIDNFTAVYISTQYRHAIPLILLIVVILFRPQGLFGRAEERRL